ncbi:MAG TPA: chloride channel protein [Candidatus Saccharimonadales bacterium]|nr:chloride channel protein [Candidatus Saccharimonadales bacterium]
MSDPAAVAKRTVRSSASRLTRFFWRDPNTQFVGLAVLVGLLGAAGAIVFRWLTSRLTILLMQHPDVVSGAASLPAWKRVLWPALGGLLGGLVARLFVRTGGTMGIAQIMEVVAVGRRTINFRQSAARTASSLLVISAGGSEGREGPIIQLGAAFASLLGRLARVSPERARVLVACGMAAGVAGAYNTPISGTLFVVELVLGSFTMAVFGPAIISAFVSSVVTRWMLGDAPLYRIQPFTLTTFHEYLLCAAVGLLTAVGSVLFMRMLRLAKKGFSKLGWKDEWRMCLAGIGVGVIGIWFPQVFGNGFEGTNFILNSQPVLWMLAALFLAKMAATDLTVGSGGVGGIFTPALMCGSALGGSLAFSLNTLFPGHPLPVAGFAVLGMGGFLAGITRAPALSIIMIVELTQNESLVLPMMIVAIVSISATGLFERKSVYVEELEESGVEWHDRPESTALSTVKVRELMRRDVTIVPHSLPLSEIVKIFLQTRAFYVFVGDERGRLEGAIDLHDLKEFLGDRTFSDPDLPTGIIAADVVREVPFVTPDESLASASERLWGVQDLGWLPVCSSREDRLFLGMITRRDLLGEIDREILRSSRFLARVSHEGLSGKEVDYFELPDRHRLMQLDVGTGMYGKTIGEIGLRKRLGITVLAVKRLTRQGLERRFVPTPEDRLEKGDKLIVLADPEAVARYEQDAAG